ncbi:MAG: hypothetical protein HC910_03990 [Spirulinaceae cyanobacterium SM2_1_0]|nr:hypothetical protein [Spirulinaceae cyanobacterium SM2_1_0]
MPASPDSIQLCQHLTLTDFCTCTQTYQQFSAQIDPYPRNWDESLAAIQVLCSVLLAPIIDRYGADQFQLTYGFCSMDLKRFLNRKDPITGRKYGRVDPSRDQHMAAEKNRNDRYFCLRGGAACDFLIRQTRSDRLVDWILATRLPFDSLYFYSPERPIHLSYGPQHKRAIWTFTDRGTPTQRGLDRWRQLAGEI